ncbi:5-formyltetrahydrofolate cyclo-ligase [Galbitalea sp. SE-J8]|uniref:5-formyltetrahydrofolate cyclo-ligase n=1 Tax=Galbitalea sp. SE-J8 TaxID=3054952 RepID=UPI00259CC4E7|nr:5-formyltetrahydrofolate cyclo-ligase [Galbitalea sp. SE-J8]MDM4762010.1 5-formyltetrahydrofolate cyclo-ligase [Galbitalea sp. SE-J8]
MGDEIGDEKRALRAELRERRRVRTATERTDAEVAITANLIGLVEAQSVPVRSLAAYLSLPDEPPTRPFVRWAHDRGIRVLLPVSRADGLLDWAPYEGGDELEDALGMPAPTTDILSPMAINDVDLIVVPAAAVDRTGMRMGWGLGYFDKTIGSMSRCPPVYAVLFDDEYVDEVPRERHDEPVNGVVTPSAVITI